MRTILDLFLVRVCKKCIPRAFVWYGKAAEQVRLISSDLSDAILHPTTFSKYFVVYDPVRDTNDKGRNFILQIHVDSVLKQYKDLGTSKSSDYSKRIKIWFDDMHKWEIKEGKERRFADIKARLRQEGWGKELDNMSAHDIVQMSKLPFIRQSDWPKVMGVLEDRLTKARMYRTQDEYRDVLRARLDALRAAIVKHCDQLPQTSSIITATPAPIDFAYMRKCRVILDLPLSETVTADHFASVVPDLVTRWNKDVKKQLTRYIRRYIPRTPTGVDPLGLAIAVFTCCDSSTASDMRYPAILNHRCLRRAQLKIPSAQDDLYSRVLMQPTTRAEWLALYYHADDENPPPTSDVPFDASRLKEGRAASAAIEHLRRIVSALGLDAKRATIDELKACGGSLRCTNSKCEPACSKGVVKRAYDWAAAFKHVHSARDIAVAQVMWQRIDYPEVLATVQSLKAREDLSSKEAWWCCSSCLDFDAGTPGMKAHLSTQHDIKDIHQAVCDGSIYSHSSKAHNEGYCIEIPVLHARPRAQF
ncbi:uncharacterized protein TRAVEDRAFT_47159 [Trametes versicolor FP-101664 SS1]|uniref:uncharacterized protein n=1 Tax=Trametes versicolor (strain FP-101664) TaxID=717944 RepID=UPI0004623D64|nr:uncharacterized protein TRAVEDRAFT_47159 [Trametes versicolor FP-101664 SS1]EIW59858.1 hypothetical protein TRAVEDRAFT_47159 [Trametes versicolor FP-101664 SS1]